MVFPVVVGSGKRLFEDGMDTTVLKLVDTKVLGSGVVVLTYEPAGRSLVTPLTCASARSQRGTNRYSTAPA
jgi:hypothetical protein